MTIQKQSAITPDTKISDLTVSEFRQLMKEMLDETLFHIEQLLPDPDEGKEFTPEFAEQLREAIADTSPLIMIEEAQRLLEQRD